MFSVHSVMNENFLMNGEVDIESEGGTRVLSGDIFF